MNNLPKDLSLMAMMVYLALTGKKKKERFHVYILLNVDDTRVFCCWRRGEGEEPVAFPEGHGGGGTVQYMKMITNFLLPQTMQ